MIVLPEKSKIASFDVDCQNTFTPLCPGELPVPDAEAIVPALNAQAALAAYRLGSKDSHSLSAEWLASSSAPALTRIEAENMDLRWPAHAVVGTHGFRLLEGLPAISAYDYFVWKGVEPSMHPYGACYHDLKERLSTGVIEFLRDKQVETVFVGGLATDYCVKTTCLQLKQAGFTVILNLSATRGLTSESISLALTALQQAQITIIENIDIL